MAPKHNSSLTFGTLVVIRVCTTWHTYSCKMCKSESLPMRLTVDSPLTNWLNGKNTLKNRTQIACLSLLEIKVTCRKAELSHYQMQSRSRESLTVSCTLKLPHHVLKGVIQSRNSLSMSVVRLGLNYPDNQIVYDDISNYLIFMSTI